MESDHNPSTFRASVVPNNPYFENNVSLQMWEIYMDFGGIWKLIFIKFWWSGDAGTLMARILLIPGFCFTPADTNLTTKQNTGQSVRGAGCENLFGFQGWKLYLEFGKQIDFQKHFPGCHKLDDLAEYWTVSQGGWLQKTCLVFRGGFLPRKLYLDLGKQNNLLKQSGCRRPDD